MWQLNVFNCDKEYYIFCEESIKYSDCLTASRKFFIPIHPPKIKCLIKKVERTFLMVIIYNFYKKQKMITEQLISIFCVFKNDL